MTTQVLYHFPGVRSPFVQNQDYQRVAPILFDPMDTIWWIKQLFAEEVYGQYERSDVLYLVTDVVVFFRNWQWPS